MLGSPINIMAQVAARFQQPVLPRLLPGRLQQAQLCCGMMLAAG